MRKSVTQRRAYKIALLGCSLSKRAIPCPAAKMYTGSIFRWSLQIATRDHYDFIFILSSKYGLVDLHQIIHPYDEYLGEKKKRDRLLWAEKVRADLVERGFDLALDTFDAYAGKSYIEHLPFAVSKFPKAGMGKIKRFLKLKAEQRDGLLFKSNQ